MKHVSDRAIGLEAEIIDGIQLEIGRDPRKMTRQEIEALGHVSLSPLQANRARCLECCCYQPSEVRRCVSVNCPSWPFRMGWNPWRDRSATVNEAVRAKREAALAKARAAKNSVNGTEKSG